MRTGKINTNPPEPRVHERRKTKLRNENSTMYNISAPPSHCFVLCACLTFAARRSFKSYCWIIYFLLTWFTKFVLPLNKILSSALVLSVVLCTDRNAKIIVFNWIVIPNFNYTFKVVNIVNSILFPFNKRFTRWTRHAANVLCCLMLIIKKVLAVYEQLVSSVITKLSQLLEANVESSY